MSRSIVDLDKRFQPLVRQLLDEANKLTSPWLTFITDGFRTYAEQAKLYAQGRTAPGKIVTNAPPGTSNHEKGLAVDLAFQKDGLLSYDVDLYGKIVPIARKLNIDWGGDWTGFPDKPHFEKLSFETSGTIIEDMNDQTKISKELLGWTEDLEIQAIRGKLFDLKKSQDEIVSLKLTVQALNDRVSILEQNTPQNPPSSPTDDSTPSVETPTTPSSLSRLWTRIKKIYLDIISNYG
jgi:peptidoglycan L-alanyl-D-glutamate endopeptidase CwlK